MLLYIACFLFYQPPLQPLLNCLEGSIGSLDIGIQNVFMIMGTRSRATGSDGTGTVCMDHILL